MLIALALGAKAVLYGRPWVYGPGIAGPAGVRHALRLLLVRFRLDIGSDRAREARRIEPIVRRDRPLSRPARGFPQFSPA
jgi:hypothetical protein